MFAGTLGTIDSQPGTVQPGYFCTGVAEWHGPLPLAQVEGDVFRYGQPIKVVNPRTLTAVPLSSASQMSLTDHSWWVMH